MDAQDDRRREDEPAFDPKKWDEQAAPRPDWSHPVSRAQKTLAVCIVAFAVFWVGYRLIVSHGQGRSGLMFIGLPTVLAVLLALAPPARTAKGGIAKGITLALLVIAPMLGEGYLCILIASPLFYLIGLIVGAIVDHYKQSRVGTVACITLLMLPMCLEGVVPQWSLPRAQTVEATRIIAAPAAGVQSALAGPMQYQQTLPRFLRIGFPRPIAAWGNGLNVGDERGLHFTGAEGTPPGDLRMRVIQSQPGYLRMQTVSDGSKVIEWLHWRDTEVAWRSVDATHTRVTTRVHFDRGLDPAWYFTAWERFAAQQAAEYLITANATPAGAR
jgi:hypothetical protein